MHEAAEQQVTNRLEMNLEAERRRNDDIQNINNENPFDEMRYFKDRSNGLFRKTDEFSPKTFRGIAKKLKV